MVDHDDNIIGFVLFSSLHIEGKYEDELLLLSPVAVKTEFRCQYISKDLIEFGLHRAKELQYKAVLVEENPKNYHPRGFKTVSDYGIYAEKKINLPHVDCLMILKLIPGALEHIYGYVSYDFYETLS